MVLLRILGKPHHAEHCLFGHADEYSAACCENDQQQQRLEQGPIRILGLSLTLAQNQEAPSDPHKGTLNAMAGGTQCFQKSLHLGMVAFLLNCRAAVRHGCSWRAACIVGHLWQQLERLAHRGTVSLLQPVELLLDCTQVCLQPRHVAATFLELQALQLARFLAKHLLVLGLVLTELVERVQLGADQVGTNRITHAGDKRLHSMALKLPHL
mmetsp:Transcript_45113/g.119296  ORF Transcript_45113/g.119296 Transcript_45113/m.119296 type:complete len:211 (-) Transcript_45113:1511-2143(-)